MIQSQEFKTDGEFDKHAAQAAYFSAYCRVKMAASATLERVLKASEAAAFITGQTLFVDGGASLGSL